jgi:hypothetical protein
MPMNKTPLSTVEGKRDGCIRGKGALYRSALRGLGVRVAKFMQLLSEPALNVGATVKTGAPDF